MYIFGVQLQAKPGRGGEAGTAIAALRDAASAAIGRTGYAWTAIAGAPVGSFGLSARVEGVSDLIEIQMQLRSDDDYQKLATESGDLWAAPGQTSWNQVVAIAGEQGDPKPVTTVTTSTISAGHVGNALAWSNEVLEYVAGVTGLGGVLTTSAAGNFFDVSWIFGADSGAAADAANAALLADPGYIAMIDQAGGLFIDGSGTRVVLMQLP